MSSSVVSAPTLSELKILLLAHLCDKLYQYIMDNSPSTYNTLSTVFKLHILLLYKNIREAARSHSAYTRQSLYEHTSLPPPINLIHIII